MPGCAVKGCLNNNYGNKSYIHVTFHRFPKEKSVQDKWLTNCDLELNTNVTNLRICSDHFRKEDFENDLKSKLLNLKPKAILKPTAIPFLKTVEVQSSNCEEVVDVNENNAEEHEPNNANTRAFTKPTALPFLETVGLSSLNCVEVVDGNENNADEHDPNNGNTTAFSKPTALPVLETVGVSSLNCEEVVDGNENNADEHDPNNSNTSHCIPNVTSLERGSFGFKLNQQSCQETAISSNHDDMINEIKELKSEIERLKKELSSANLVISALRFQLKKYEELYTDSQKDLLITGKCTNWSADDISKAITIRSLSPKAFQYVKDILKYPLPSERTIKRKLSKIVVRPGLIDLSMSILRAHANVFTDFERDVIMSFDEMKVKSDLCYDSIDDCILGPHTNVQVIIIRSLIGKWKQPVYYGFDQSVDKDLFFDVVRAIEATGFHVRGFVCDLGGSNRKLLSELEIQLENTSVRNPCDDHRRIWAFSDVPHMLKLLRNHLLDEGFLLCDGRTVQKEVLQSLIESQSGDLKYTYKLTQNHLLVSGTERQNVRKAAELLSGTTANAIRHCQPHNAHVGDTIDIVNDGFDVLNSRFPKHPNNILKSAYGTNLEEQNVALKKLKELCLSMRVIGRKDLLPFQRGFIISIRSIQGLFSELREDGYSYLMTSRCNQDGLESYFSLIRGFGRFYDHPLPVDVTRRIKSLLLSRNNAVSVIRSINVPREDDESNTLSAEVITDSIGDENANGEVLCNQTEDQEDIDYVNSELTKENDAIAFESCEHDTESNELLKVLAGYVAYRVKKKNIKSTFDYGHITGLYPSSCADWLSTISRGKLINPTPEWLHVVKQMELDFTKFHGTHELRKTKGITKNLIEELKAKYYNIDEFAVACFIRTRTFIRMKAINKRRGTKRKQYGNKSTDYSRKAYKKMAKLQ